MEKNIKKTKLIPTILIILILTISLLTIIIPITVAQEYRTKQTYAYIGAIPNPVGVNQQVLLHIGITDYLVVVGHGWEDLTVTVTKPDATTETLGPFRTDSTGGTGAIYTPTMIGTYTFVTNFPEQLYSWSRPPAFSTNIYGDILYLASTSEPLELVVQEEAIEHYPWSQLPSQYWTRPIDGQLREWSTISGNWLTTPYNHIAPYNEDAPETAHILWAKPIAMGGLAGGATGNHAFECGDAYEGFFSGTVIIGGILYYNEFNSRGGTNVEQVVVAIDLHTGEEVWRRNYDNRRLSFGQTFYWDSYNYHGVFDYLWITIGSTWKAYDAFSGRWEYTMENVPSGSNLYGPKGEIYRYTINRNAGWMTLWNSSRVVSNAGSWRPQGNTYNATDGIEWNVTIPLGLPGGTVATWFQERMIGCDAAGYVSMGDLPIHTWGIDLRPGQEGSLLFNASWTPPPGDLSITWGTRYNGAPSLEEKVYTLYARETRQHYGFSLDTGQQVWGPTPAQDYMDFIGVSNIIAEGKLFSTRMAGHLVVYDIATGNVLWEYDATDPYSEMNWANNWPIRPLLVTDGKIYYGHAVHSPIDPKPRGAPYICLDIETGEEVWRADGLFRVTDWGGRSIIGDSIIATMDSYDQQIYAIGKGPTEITIEAPLVASDWGDKIVLRGTVMDISPGTQTTGMKMRFPKGVPAVSDGDMSDWMKYVYKQFDMPMVSGVPVKLEVVVDPNYNWYDIGTAYTDATGFFSIEWEPPVPGHYLILATFEGSKSYYPTYVETSVVVNEGLTLGTSMEFEEPALLQKLTAPEQPVETQLISTEVALIATVAVIAVIGLGIFWVLRKRP